MLTNVPPSIRLEVYRGNAAAYRLTLTQGGVATALPTSGWACQIRTQRTDQDITGTFAVDTSQASAGIITISLTPATTRVLAPLSQWDLKCGDRTYVQGTLAIEKEVTRV